MPSTRISIYKRLGIPDTVAGLVTTVFLILALAPFAGGHDFGIFKVPTFTERINQVLAVIGPIGLVASLICFYPFRNTKGQFISAKAYFLPRDLPFRLYVDARNRVVRAEVKVQVTTGVIALLRKGELTDQSLNKRYFETKQIIPRVSLLSVVPTHPTIDANTTDARIVLEFNVSSVIPQAYYMVNYEDYIGHECGRLTVRLFYRDDSKEVFEDVEISMKFAA